MKTNSYLDNFHLVKKLLESQDFISVYTNDFYNKPVKSGCAYFKVAFRTTTIDVQYDISIHSEIH